MREEKCGSTVCPASGNVRKGLKRTGQEVLLPTRCAFSFPCRFFLHDLLHKGAHGLSSLVLLLLRSVGIGAEGEACVVVARHTGHGLHIHAVLQGCSGEGMPLRYNYDKPEKPRISRVFGYLARFFILFQTEKSSREVVISQGVL